MTKLKNGASVIDRDGSVVLAKTTGHLPYVTWRINEDGDCFWGNYFASLSAADADFRDRVSQFS